ncbi:MAG TPA: hypothetical protein VEJ41_04040 [Candidatus Acidoferrales bacterium]|nr:hypothetical protein [Candidatus Acidoferrales bacterium]
MKQLFSALALALVCCVCLAATAGAKQLSFDLKALNGSGESGTATIAPGADGNLVVTINLTGEPAGASQPAHIHPGTCANLNPVPKTILSNVVGGKSVTTIPRPTTPVTGARSIVVHKGPGADMSTYVACGDIPSP